MIDHAAVNVSDLDRSRSFTKRRLSRSATARLRWPAHVRARLRRPHEARRPSRRGSTTTVALRSRGRPRHRGRLPRCVLRRGRQRRPGVREHYHETTTAPSSRRGRQQHRTPRLGGEPPGRRPAHVPLAPAELRADRRAARRGRLQPAGEDRRRSRPGAAVRARGHAPRRCGGARRRLPGRGDALDSGVRWARHRRCLPRRRARIPRTARLVARRRADARGASRASSAPARAPGRASPADARRASGRGREKRARARACDVDSRRALGDPDRGAARAP